MTASFEEKSVWIQLFALLLGLGAYFLWAGSLLANGVREMSAFAALLMAAVIIMDIDNVWTANVLIMALALSELLGLILRIHSYRRGI